MARASPTTSRCSTVSGFHSGPLCVRAATFHRGDDDDDDLHDDDDDRDDDDNNSAFRSEDTEAVIIVITRLCSDSANLHQRQNFNQSDRGFQSGLPD